MKINLPACSRLEVVAPVDDKKLVSYPGARHILHMESEDCRIEFIGGSSIHNGDSDEGLAKFWENGTEKEPLVDVCRIPLF